jgi:hypothetical protein
VMDVRSITGLAAGSKARRRGGPETTPPTSGAAPITPSALCLDGVAAFTGARRGEETRVGSRNKAVGRRPLVARLASNSPAHRWRVQVRQTLKSNRSAQRRSHTSCCPELPRMGSAVPPACDRDLPFRCWGCFDSRPWSGELEAWVRVEPETDVERGDWSPRNECSRRYAGRQLVSRSSAHAWSKQRTPLTCCHLHCLV